MRDIGALNDLIIYCLQSLLDTELKWSEELDQVLFEVSSPELKTLLITSADLSRNHLRILGETLEEFEDGESFTKALPVKGLIEEMKEVVNITTDPRVKDAAILFFHQCVGHFKIAQYGTVISYAKLLKMEAVATTLHHLLEEEKAADEVLSQLAETKINPGARSPLLQR